MRDDLVAWLEALPVDTPVALDRETVYLSRRSNGAELGIRLIDNGTQEQVLDALRLGCASAMHFDAGLAYGPDNRTVFLTRWLPGAYSWPDANAALEQILHQAAAWRAWLTPAKHAPALIDPAASDRAQQRLLALFAERKR